jgi:hypothetical protein
MATVGDGGGIDQDAAVAQVSRMLKLGVPIEKLLYDMKMTGADDATMKVLEDKFLEKELPPPPEKVALGVLPAKGMLKEEAQAAMMKKGAYARWIGGETLYVGDGGTVARTADGLELELMEDGSKVQKNPDGSVIVWQPDGIFFDTKPDGTVIEQHPNGYKKQTNPNGTIVEVLFNGTKIQHNTDGSVFQMAPDGTFTQTNPDGVKIVKTKDGKKTQYNADGTVLHFKHGVQQQTNPDGTVITQAQGKLKEVRADGTVYEKRIAQAIAAVLGTESNMEPGPEDVVVADDDLARFIVNLDKYDATRLRKVCADLRIPARTWNPVLLRSEVKQHITERGSHQTSTLQYNQTASMAGEVPSPARNQVRGADANVTRDHYPVHAIAPTGTARRE